MNKMQFGCTVLLTIGIAAACGDDPVTTNSSEEDLLALSSGSGGSDRGGGNSGRRQIAMLDDCDKRDPAWNTVGGCTIRGAVTLQEFIDFASSPLYPTTVVGHPAWTNEPSYLKIREGTKVRVTNEGGRTHTFTEVEHYGGGRAPNPALNKGLIIAPECDIPSAADRTSVPPGGKLDLERLAAGNHKFQCCLHPWMRALIKVEAHGKH